MQLITCSCGRFQHDDVPCGHAIAVIQGYHDPTGGPRRSVRDFVAYNLTVPAFRATCAAPSLQLRLQDYSLAMTCSAGLLSLERREVALKPPV